MTVILFTRSQTDEKSRIYVGVNYDGVIYRIGHRVIQYNNSIKLERHFYKETSEVWIVENPDESRIEKQDLEYYKNFYLKSI